MKAAVENRPERFREGLWGAQGYWPTTPALSDRSMSAFQKAMRPFRRYSKTRLRKFIVLKIDIDRIAVVFWSAEEVH